jgi:hypothetical protein
MIKHVRTISLGECGVVIDVGWDDLQGLVSMRGADRERDTDFWGAYMSPDATGHLADALTHAAEFARSRYEAFGAACEKKDEVPK